MSLLNGNAPIPVCSRCGIARTPNEDVCHQCGYQFPTIQYAQHGLPIRLPSNQTAQPSQPAPSSLKTRPGSRLSDYKHLSNAQLHDQPTKQPQTVLGSQFTPAYHVKQQQASPRSQFVQESQPLSPSHVTLTQTAWSSSQMQPAAVHVSQVGWMPQTVPVSSLRATPMAQPASSSPQSIQMRQTTQPSAVSLKQNEPSATEGRRALVYFTTVFVATMLLVFAVFHAAGTSLSALTLHSSATSTPITYPVPRSMPLLADTFQDDSTGWNLQSVTGSYVVAIGNGKLMLEDDKNSLLWEVLPGTRAYSNFELRVNAVLAKGDANNGYGIYVRSTPDAQSDLASYYRFELYGDGSYAIFKGQPGTDGLPTETRLTRYVVDSAIQKQGKLNHIIIVARGAFLSFIVNNQLLTTIKDGSYPGGSIALFVSNLPKAKPGAQVQFSQLVIYPV